MNELPAPGPGSRLVGQYLEIEQPVGSVIEMHVMRLVGPSERIPLVVRFKAEPSDWQRVGWSRTLQSQKHDNL